MTRILSCGQMKKMVDIFFIKCPPEENIFVILLRDLSGDTDGKNGTYLVHKCSLKSENVQCVQSKCSLYLLSACRVLESEYTVPILSDTQINRVTRYSVGSYCKDNRQTYLNVMATCSNTSPPFPL